MRHILSTSPTGHPSRCPSRRVRVRLPLATVDELDHLAHLTHTTRQQIVRQILAAALISDTPLQPAGPDPAQRLVAHARLTQLRSLELIAARADA